MSLSSLLEKATSIREGSSRGANVRLIKRPQAGLVTKGCVRFGEEETRDSWSCVDGVEYRMGVSVGGRGC